MNVLSEHRQTAQGVPDLLLYDSLVADGVMLLQDGALLAAWRYRGPDMQSRTVEEMAALSARVNRALRIGSGWMFHVDAIRRNAPDYPEHGEFPDAVTSAIDEERAAQFRSEGRHYESEYFLAVTYLPPVESEEKVRGWVFTGGRAEATAAERTLKFFMERVAVLEDTLKIALRVERLCATADGKDELLGYIRECVTGECFPFASLDVPTCLQDVIGCVDLVGGVMPILGGKHMRVLAIDGFPNLSRPGMLGALDELPFAYRWNTRLMPQDTQVALGVLGVTKKKWRSKTRGWFDQIVGRQSATLNEFAVEMESDAQGAMSVANAGDVQYAIYSSNIIILDESEIGVKEKVARVRKLIHSHGFGCREEGVNALEAWRGSHPGNGYANVRRFFPHTLNIADMMPLASVWGGAAVNPSELMQRQGATAPLMLAATSGATPFRLNLHVSDLGHSLVIGPPGSGKSTSLALIAAQWFRYPRAQVFAFDKGYSLQTLCRAAGGYFYDPGGAEAVTFCPLQNLDTDGPWAVGWLETLCVLQGAIVGPAERNQLAEAVRLMRDSPSRTLTELYTNIQNARIREALEAYTVGSGHVGELLDASEDSISDGRFICFEMSNLMGLGNKAVSAVLPYLFHRIQRRLEDGNGEPTLIILDEAWLFLDNPIFEQQIKEWLKTLRKLNAVVILSTQNLSDCFNSKIFSVILESCPTKILLPNVEATNPASRAHYEQLGLNQREIEIIATAAPKREYYVISADGRRLIELGLGEVARSFCGVTSQEERRSVEAMIARYGARWPLEWLHSRGLHDWAAHIGRAIHANIAFAAAGD